MAGKSITQKIIEAHLVPGYHFEPGKQIAIKIDRAFFQDATGTAGALALKYWNIPRVKIPSYVFIDHKLARMDYRDFDDHSFLRSIAAKYGLVYLPAGRSICHQAFLEFFAVPGETVAGSDSHTPMAGAEGALAIADGGVVVASVMIGEPLYFICPKVARVILTGKLRPWVTAMDVALKILEKCGTGGNVGYVLEFDGDGLEDLSVTDRATIGNMSGTETGASSIVFPSDENARRFLKAQGRERNWQEIKADGNAIYDKEIVIDLGEVEPLVACPHSPGNVKPLRELSGKKVHYIRMGSCTNSSFHALMMAAHVLRGRKIHPDVHLIITPGSLQVVQMLIENGAYNDLLSAGAEISQPGCWGCVGISQTPGTNFVCASTHNRNFKGRTGEETVENYLLSILSAAAAALKGELGSPEDLEDMGVSCPVIEMPERFHVDEGMFVLPPKDGSTIQVRIGPNIKDLPKGSPLPDEIICQVAGKFGDKLTTGHILPAGGGLISLRSNAFEYAKHVLVKKIPGFYDRTKRIRKNGHYSVVVAGRNCGEGSSREHAAICPRILDVIVFLAKSFHRLFFTNCLNWGILPLVFVNEDDYDKIEEWDVLSISGIHEALNKGESLFVDIERGAKRFRIEVECRLSKEEVGLFEEGREALFTGSKLALIKNKNQ